MTVIPDPSDNLPTLLRAWARIVGEQGFAAEMVPWWLDQMALMQSMVHAAETSGWSVQPLHDEEWDVQFLTPETRVVIRCVSVGVDLEQTEGWGVIGDAWRVLALTPPPPSGTLGFHLVTVLPYMAHAGDESATRSAVALWRSTQPFPREEMSVWVEAPSPMPRNNVGTAFPGLGLIAHAVTE